MKRDVIVSVFLFYIFLALIFVLFFPVYFAYGQIFFRSVSVIERIMSVFFVLAWLTLCAYSAYYKKLTFLFGGVLYSFLAYLPEMVLPGLSTAAPGAEQTLFSVLADGFMRRLYELINAPMVGISVLFPPEKAVGISKLMLPVLVVFYVATQIFRFYRNAYLADQLLLNDVPQSSNSFARKDKEPAADQRSKRGVAAILAKLSANRAVRVTGGIETAGDEPVNGERRAMEKDEAFSEEVDEPMESGLDVLSEPAGSVPEELAESAEDEFSDSGEKQEDKRVFDISLSSLEEKAKGPSKGE